MRLSPYLFRYSCMSLIFLHTSTSISSFRTYHDFMYYNNASSEIILILKMLFTCKDSTGTAPGPEQFKVGMKFESFDPLNPSHTVVVTVIKVLKFNYFVLGIDSLATYFCCHANSRNIFPVGWSKRHGISLIPPRGEWADSSLS